MISDNKGFSLIELIVVIAIIIILIALIVPHLSGQISKAKWAQTVGNTKVIYTAATTALAELIVADEVSGANECDTLTGEDIKAYVKEQKLLDSSFDSVYDEITINYDTEKRSIISVTFRDYTYPE